MIESRLVDVNRAIALEFLSKEKTPEAGVKGTNRKHSERAVAEYAAAMLRDEWADTHQGIAFNVDDEMVDGGHRMRAVVLAAETKPDITIRFMVTTGLPREAMSTFDIGRRRVPADFLRMMGEVNTSTLGGIIRLVYCYDNVPWQHNESWARHRITPRIQEKVLSENPGLREAVYETYPLKKLFKSSALGAFWFLANRERPDVNVEEFLEQLRSGENLAKNSPTLTLRDLMLNSKAALRRFEASEELALLVKAFNKWIRGEESILLAFRSNEAFPRIIEK